MLTLDSDEDLYRRLCEGCRDKRLQLAFTQAELATRAGLSQRTVRNFENGGALNVRSLMKLMRAIGELARMEALIPETLSSPREIFRQGKKKAPKRKRVRRASS